MCGIAGQICPPVERADQMEQIYQEMQNVLVRRGPDQKEMYICENAAMIHARLCVVDPKNGTQPMQLRRDEEYILYQFSYSSKRAIYREKSIEYASTGVANS